MESNLRSSIEGDQAESKSEELNRAPARARGDFSVVGNMGKGFHISTLIVYLLPAEFNRLRSIPKSPFTSSAFDRFPTEFNRPKSIPINLNLKLYWKKLILIKIPIN